MNKNKQQQHTVPMIHQMNTIIPKIIPKNIAITTPIPLLNENERVRRITKIDASRKKTNKD